MIRLILLVAIVSLGIYALLRLLCRQRRYKREYEKQCRNYIKRKDMPEELPDDIDYCPDCGAYYTKCICMDTNMLNELEEDERV